MKKNIIITGIPKSGKSTLLKKIISNLDNKVGFVTNEVRENGERIGFEIENYSGKKQLIASINYKTDLKVSKYFVDIKNLEKIIPKVKNFNQNNLLYIDEIGQMQLFSEKFKNLVIKYLNSSNTGIFTLSKIYSNEFTEEIKNRKDIILIEITAENREEKQIYLEKLIKKIEKAKRYISEPERFSIEKNKAKIKTDHGIRNLKYSHKEWSCECDFFQENNICSHKIALEEFLELHH